MSPLNSYPSLVLRIFISGLENVLPLIQKAIFPDPQDVASTAHPEKGSLKLNDKHPFSLFKTFHTRNDIYAFSTRFGQRIILSFLLSALTKQGWRDVYMNYEKNAGKISY